MDTCSIIMAVALYNTKDAQHTALLGLFSFSDEDEILENGLNQLLLFVCICIFCWYILLGKHCKGILLAVFMYLRILQDTFHLMLSTATSEYHLDIVSKAVKGFLFGSMFKHLCCYYLVNAVSLNVSYYKKPLCNWDCIFRQYA